MRAVRKEKANRLSFREIAFGASDRWRLPFRFLSIRRESRACPLIGCEVADFFLQFGWHHGESSSHDRAGDSFFIL